MLTASKFEREKECASVWNWGYAIAHSAIPSSSSGEPSATPQPNSATNATASNIPVTSTHPASHDESLSNAPYSEDTSGIETVTVKSAAAYFKKKSIILIDYALYDDLKNCLYANRLVPEQGCSPLYVSMREIATRFVFLIILRMEELRDVIINRPISHVFADIMACVKFLRETAALDWEKQIGYEDEYQRLTKRRERFWKRILTTAGTFQIPGLNKTANYDR